MESPSRWQDVEYHSASIPFPFSGAFQYTKVSNFDFSFSNLFRDWYGIAAANLIPFSLI